jgi:hypothetical protein
MCELGEATTGVKLKKKCPFDTTPIFCSYHAATPVVQMDNKELPKKILWTNPVGQRGSGRQKSRWIDGVKEDPMEVSCSNRPAGAQE